MNTFRIRHLNEADLPAVAAMEAICFPPQEAASLEKYAWRLKNYPSLFLACQDDDGQLAGCICMISMAAPLICDEAFGMERLPDGSVCAILSLMTRPQNQRQGVATKLLESAVEVAQDKGFTSMVLTCKEHLVRYYEKFGFTKQGVSQSVHGGAVWYDMVRRL